MKKSIIMFAVVAMGFLASCSPEKEEKTIEVTRIPADQLLANATFKQFAAVLDADGKITGYTEAADGNYIEFNVPGVSGLNIYVMNPDGTERELVNVATGSNQFSGGGMFVYIPKRGSDPRQTVYFRYINQVGEAVVASKEFTLTVAADLEPAIKFLASNAGIKKWKWDMSINGQAWGNMAYAMGDGADFANAGANQWWGCAPEMLWFDGDGGQYGHTDKDDAKKGEGDRHAYMTFDEDGKIKTYDANGNVLRAANYKVLNYDGKRHEVGGVAWDLGTLQTTEPAIMYPYKINGGGTTVTDFEILGLDDDQLVLVYPGTSSPGSWSEATFWRFVAEENEDLFYKDWTWELKVYDGETDSWVLPAEGSTSVCWGNLAYAMGNGEEYADKAANQWWGTEPEMLWYNGEGGQYGHTDKDDAKKGEGDRHAYMRLDDAGKITTFDANGNVLRTANFKTELFDEREDVGGNPWHIGTLETTAPAVMYPYMINGNGTTVTKFQIMKLTGTSMVLVYPGASEPGSWAEATFWRFTKKK